MRSSVLVKFLKNTPQRTFWCVRTFLTSKDLGREFQRFDHIVQAVYLFFSKNSILRLNFEKNWQIWARNACIAERPLGDLQILFARATLPFAVFSRLILPAFFIYSNRTMSKFLFTIWTADVFKREGHIIQSIPSRYKNRWACDDLDLSGTLFLSL